MRRINDYVIIEEGINKAARDGPYRHLVPEVSFKQFYGASYKQRKIDAMFYLRSAVEQYYKEFSDLLGDLTEFEKLLYATNKFYRDHVLHTFRVWGLGIYMYVNGLSKFITMNDGTDFFPAWHLASTYHDVGYPLANLKNLEKELQGYFSYLNLENIVSLGTGIQEKLSFPDLESNNCKLKKLLYDENTAGNVLKERHGLTSSRILLFNLVERFNTNWAPWADVAMCAIANHDGDNTISFKDDPISALLIVCDELQEWGRPYITQRLGDTYTTTDHIELDLSEDGSIPVIKARIDYRNTQLNLFKTLGWEGEQAEQDKMQNLNRIGDGIRIDVKMNYFKREQLENL